MREKIVKRSLFVMLLVSGVFLISPTSSQAIDPREWSGQIADKVEAFLPSPASGLTERFPWDPQDFNRVKKSWGCGESVCTTYPYVDVTRMWRIADSERVKEYEPLTKQEEALMERSEKLGRKITKQEMTQIMAEVQQIEDKKKKIESGSRYIEVRIRLNQTAEGRLGTNAKSVGMIKGYPFYRNDGHLAVNIGPRRFENPDLPQGQKQRMEIKCIVVEVELRSSPSSIKSDEALAKQMLERINCEGLAKLLSP